MYNGYLRSLNCGTKMLLARPIFLRIKNVIIGMITVRIKTGSKMGFRISGGLYFGVIKK